MEEFESTASAEPEAPSSPASDPSLAASEHYVKEVAKDQGADLSQGSEPQPAERRASTEMARARIDESYRRKKETERALTESRSQMANLQREMLALRQQNQQFIQQQQRPAANPDPEPDRNDPTKAHDWALWAARQAQAPLAQRLSTMEQIAQRQYQQAQQQQQAYYQAQQQEHAFRGEVTRIDQLEAEYEQVSPGYRSRVDNYLQRSMDMHLQQGYPPLAAQAQAVQDFYSLFQRGEQLGRHPAAFVDYYLGGGGQEAQQEAQEAAPAPRRVREMQNALSAPEAGSLSQGGSRAPQEAGAVATLSRHGKAPVKARDLKKRLSGGNAKDQLNQLYNLAARQSAEGR